MERHASMLIVGFILALLFAAAMATSNAAIMITEFMQPGRALTEQTRLSLKLAAAAGGLAALLAWLLQMFVAARGFFTRLTYGVLSYALAFFAIGGLLVVMRNYYGNPAPGGFSFAEFYSASMSGFYSFALFIFAPPRIAFFGLLLAAGLILALVGPRRIIDRRKERWR